MPAGTTYAGAGPAGADPVGALSAPAILIQTSNAALWDVATKSVLVDATSGLVKRIHWVDQAVALALGIPIGSLSSQPTLGHTLRLIKRGDGPTLKAEVDDAVRLALKTLLDAGDIVVISVVTTTPIRSQIVVAVSYMNMRLPGAKFPDNLLVAF